MEVTKPIEICRIEELKILHDVRLVHSHDLNAIASKNNVRVQFELSGEIQGGITCYLNLDGHELSSADRNYIYPLFVESMNILIGRQISMDDELSHFKMKLSTPKLNMNSLFVTTDARGMTHVYKLELEDGSFDVLIQYALEILN
jgi:hypothetical protein